MSSAQTFLPGVHESQNLAVNSAHRDVKGSLNLIALVICISNSRLSTPLMKKERRTLKRKRGA